jgi:hypothetical protein
MNEKFMGVEGSGPGEAAAEPALVLFRCKKKFKLVGGSWGFGVHVIPDENERFMRTPVS